MKFFTTAKLGPKRALTPEGFLICYDVPLARTGEMIYGPDESPIKPGADGLVHILREPEEVFRPETIASFNGKAYCVLHPDDDITPANYRQLAHGHIIDPRRGEGDQDHLLIGDLVITDPSEIEAVNRSIEDGEMPELSCGYDADWIEDAERPGWGWQENIIGNHVARVPNGRCGARCAIGDRHHRGESSMAAKKGAGLRDMLRRAFKAKDEKELETLEKELEEHEKARDEEGEGEGGKNVTVNVHHPEAGDGKYATKEEFDAHVKDNADEHAALAKRIEALEAGKTEDKAKDEAAAKELEEEFEEEAPAGTGDKARKAKDSAYFEDSFQDALAGAEILAPGIRTPVFDRAAAPKTTLNAVCKLRRTALDLAYHTPEMRDVIEELNGKKPLVLDGMPCGKVRSLFNAAVTARKAQNNAGAKREGARDTNAKPKGIRSIDEWNEANRNFYKEGAH